MIKKKLVLVVFCFAIAAYSYAQSCSGLGQIPSAAFPVCGSSVFHESTIVNCSGPNISQSVCTEPVTSGSSSWYKFTCFQTGTLGFLLSGISGSDDYDWALFDVTGQNPNAIFSNPSRLVPPRGRGSKQRSLLSPSALCEAGCPA